MAPSGRSRVSGLTTHITLKLVTRTVPARKAAWTGTEISAASRQDRRITGSQPRHDDSAIFFFRWCSVLAAGFTGNHRNCKSQRQQGHENSGRPSSKIEKWSVHVLAHQFLLVNEQ